MSVVGNPIPNAHFSIALKVVALVTRYIGEVLNRVYIISRDVEFPRGKRHFGKPKQFELNNRETSSSMEKVSVIMTTTGSSGCSALASINEEKPPPFSLHFTLKVIYLNK
jgi:hypothetical protein